MNGVKICTCCDSHKTLGLPDRPEFQVAIGTFRDLDSDYGSHIPLCINCLGTGYVLTKEHSQYKFYCQMRDLGYFLRTPRDNIESRAVNGCLKNMAIIMDGLVGEIGETSNTYAKEIRQAELEKHEIFMKEFDKQSIVKYFLRWVKNKWFKLKFFVKSLNVL